MSRSFRFGRSAVLRKRIVVLVWGLVLVVSGRLNGGQEPEPSPLEVRFQEARHLEVGEGRIESALSVYLEIVDEETAPRGLRGRALLRAGFCFEKLEDGERALDAFRRIVLEFAELGDLVEAAQGAMRERAEIEDELKKKIDALVSSLGNEPWAYSRLEKLGPKAAPQLIEALRVGNPRISELGVRLLVHYAKVDPAVQKQILETLRICDEVLAKDLGENLGTSGILALEEIEKLARDESPKARLAAVMIASKNLRCGPLLVGLCVDPSEAVRLAAVEAFLSPRWSKSDYGVSFFSDATSVPVETQVDLLRDASPAVRIAAVRWIPMMHAFRETADSRVTRCLFERLFDPVWAVSNSTLNSLALEYRDGTVEFPSFEGSFRGEVFSRLCELVRVQRSAWFALDLIVAMNREESRDFLFEVLGYPDPTIVQRVVEILSKRPIDPRAIEPMKRLLLSSSSEQVRDGVVKFLWWLVEQEGLPSARRFVLQNLSKVSDSYIPSILKTLLVLKDRELTLLALEAEPKLSDVGRLALLRTVSEMNFVEAAPVFVRFLKDKDLYRVTIPFVEKLKIEDAVPTLLEILDEGQESQICLAVAGLSKIGDPRVGPALLGLLKRRFESRYREGSRAVEAAIFEALEKDESSSVRELAIESFEKYPEKWMGGGFAVLRRWVSEPGFGAIVKRVLTKDRISSFAEWSQGRGFFLLGATGDPKVLPTLRLAFESEDTEVRRQGFEALVAIGGPHAVPELHRVLEQGTKVERQRVFESLRMLRDPRSLQPVLRLAETDLELRSRAASTLGAFGDGSVLPRLLALLETENEKGMITRAEDWLDLRQGREAILESLPMYDPELGLEAAVTIVSEDRFSLDAKRLAVGVLAGIAHPRAVEEITKLLGSPRQEVRVEAIRETGRFLDPRSLPGLVRLLKDPEDAIRSAAKGAIEEIRYYLGQERLVAELNPDGDSAVTEEALTALLTLLGSEEPRVRVEAAVAVSRLGERVALPHLVRLRKDPDPQVRARVDVLLTELTEAR